MREGYWCRQGECHCAGSGAVIRLLAHSFIAMALALGLIVVAFDYLDPPEPVVLVA